LNWQTDRGYLVKLSQAETLDVTGKIIGADTTVQLNDGYNLIPVYVNDKIDAKTVLTSVPGFELAKDEDGNTLRMIEGEWVNNIGDLEAGKAYLVKVTGIPTVNYQVSVPVVSVAGGPLEHPSYADENKLIDHIVSDASRWIGRKDATTDIWLEFQFEEKQSLAGLHFYSGYGTGGAVTAFEVQAKDADGNWQTVETVTGNTLLQLSVPFSTDVETDAIRLNNTQADNDADDYARIREVVLWPATGNDLPPLGTGVTIP